MRKSQDRKSLFASPLMRTSWDTPEDKLKELIAREPKIDRTDKNGDTALHYTGRNTNWLKFRLLMEAGADLKTKNTQGRTPLDYYLEKEYRGRFGAELPIRYSN